MGSRDGKSGLLAAIGVGFMITGTDAEERFSLVEHPMPPRALAAPLHRHSREDEYSYVLEGRMGAQPGEDVVYAGAGDLVFKPRGQWHTFWNARDEPCRILELISPAGFERYFEELVDAHGPLTPDLTLGIAARYGLEMRSETVPQLVAEHRLAFPDPTRSGRRCGPSLTALPGRTSP